MQGGRNFGVVFAAWAVKRGWNGVLVSLLQELTKDFSDIFISLFQMRTFGTHCVPNLGDLVYGFVFADEDMDN